MKPYAVVNREAFPIVMVTFTGEKATAENFRHYLYELFLSYNERKPFSVIYITTNKLTLPIPSSQFQQEQIEWMESHEKLIKKYCRNVVYIAPHFVIKTFLKIFLYFQKHPVPYKVIGLIKDGEDWIKKQL
ncbi:MAG: STAS/SEC14 domain-containing protein [Saprospiraceae bacterium]